MSLIRIVANDIELDFVKETLTIRKENNALIRNFKVSHSSFPFLIIENRKAKMALGDRELSSVLKIKTITVKVFENDLEFYGELQILSYLKGYRKCNLKYASPLLEIMNKKISEFMPIVSVTGATSGIPNFVEESDTVFTGDTSWPAYAASFINQGFPAVKWNFPMMTFKNKFGEDLPDDDPWIDYKGKVNFFLDDTFQLNTGEFISAEVIEVHNKNVPAPQIYLLSPLFYALQSIGFTMGGDFVNNDFIKKIMLLSFKDNLCKVLLKTVTTNVVFDGAWDGILIGIYPAYRKREIYDITESGEYTITFNFVLNEVTIPSAMNYGTRLIVRRYVNPGLGYIQTDNEIVFQRKSTAAGETIEGEFTMELEDTDKLYFDFECKEDDLPSSYSLSYRKGSGDKEFYQMHPTIQTGRFLPDWTLATYINNIKNWFNLDTDIDDMTKKFVLNFNEDWLTNQLPEILNKSMKIKSYDPSPVDAFLLKNENDEDNALWIDKDGASVYTTQISPLSQTLDGKFKFVPTENSTALLSEALEDKDGVGLIIYDEANAPLTSESYNGKTLKIEGSGGIYDSYWKKWLKFRLNAGLIEIEGGFTKTEIGKFIKTKRIYFNHQDFVISLIEYKELTQENYLVTFKVESVTI